MLTMFRMYLLLLFAGGAPRSVSACINPCGWLGGYEGFCVNSNGEDLTQGGVRHVYPLCDRTTLSAAMCLEWCKSIPGANACEQTNLIHRVGNEGCYAHIASSDPRGLAVRGSGGNAHYCWTFQAVVATPTTQFIRRPHKTCFVHQVQHADDLGVGDPLFVQGNEGEVGNAINSTITLDGCKGRCIGATDLHGRPCVGVEWWDEGVVLSLMARRACNLLWGCDGTSDSTDGSVFLLSQFTPTQVPTSEPSIAPSIPPTKATTTPRTATTTTTWTTPPTTMPTAHPTAIPTLPPTISSTGCTGLFEDAPLSTTSCVVRKANGECILTSVYDLCNTICSSCTASPTTSPSTTPPILSLSQISSSSSISSPVSKTVFFVIVGILSVCVIVLIGYVGYKHRGSRRNQENVVNGAILIGTSKSDPYVPQSTLPDTTQIDQVYYQGARVDGLGETGTSRASSTQDSISISAGNIPEEAPEGPVHANAKVERDSGSRTIEETTTTTTTTGNNNNNNTITTSSTDTTSTTDNSTTTDAILQHTDGVSALLY